MLFSGPDKTFEADSMSEAVLEALRQEFCNMADGFRGDGPAPELANRLFRVSTVLTLPALLAVQFIETMASEIARTADDSTLEVLAEELPRACFAGALDALKSAYETLESDVDGGPLADSIAESIRMMLDRVMLSEPKQAD